MASETDNLRNAWRYWVAAQNLEQLNRLIESLWLIYHVEGRYRAAADITTELLDILAASPSSPERSLQEVKLRTSYARALMSIKGYTAEVEDAYAAALELFEGQRDDPRIYPVLRDLARFYIGGAEIAKAAAVGQEVLQLADAQGDPHMRLDGHLVIGTVLMFAGDLQAASDQYDQGIAAFEAPAYRARRLRFGTDPRVSVSRRVRISSSGCAGSRIVRSSARTGAWPWAARPIRSRWPTACSIPGSFTCGDPNRARG